MQQISTLLQKCNIDRTLCFDYQVGILIVLESIIFVTHLHFLTTRWYLDSQREFTLFILSQYLSILDYKVIYAEFIVKVCLL